jgi:hypothetical protein
LEELQALIEALAPRRRGGHSTKDDGITYVSQRRKKAP